MLLSDPVNVAIAERIGERAHGAKLQAAPLVVGVCGPQGSGKSTLVAIVKRLLEERGLSVAVLSLDDVYLPLAARNELARTVHPLLKTRGVPGTHDVDLALSILAALRKKGVVAIPAFDKAADDRRPQGEWARVQAPVDAILFEGWCVGAIPESERSLATPVNALERNEDPDGRWRRYVNRTLAQVYRRLFCEIDFLVLLTAPEFSIVYRWRLEQEIELRRSVAARGGDTSQLMSDAQLRRFVSHYERLTRHVLREMPARADIVVQLDAQRRKTLSSGLATMLT